MKHLLQYFRNHNLEILAVIMLFACSIFGAYFSAKFNLIRADATISIYQFMNGPLLDDLFLSDWHSNILKAPLLFVQAHLPLTMTSFVAMASALLFATGLGWSAAIAYIFGRKYFAPMSLIFGFFLAASPLFAREMGFITIRNLEYPLLFIMFILFWRAIVSRHANPPAKPGWTAIALFLVGMAVLQASDPFFTYISIPALAATLGLAAWQQRFKKGPIALGVVLIIAPYVLAKLLLAALMKINFFQYYGETLAPRVYDLNLIPQSFLNSLLDISRIFNADIFTPEASPTLLYQLALFAFLITAAIAFFIALIRLPSYVRETPGYATMLVTAPVALALYVVAPGFQHSYRFLIIVALVLCTNLLVLTYPALLSRIRKASGGFGALLVIVSVAAILCAGLLTHKQLAQENFYNFEANKDALSGIAALVESRNINTIISGHAYSSTIAFWSGKDMRIVPVLYCNQNLPFLTRESWYRPTPDTSENVAMIVDKAGRDKHSWYCSLEKIKEYYGEPIDIIERRGISNKPVLIFVYPQEVLEKIIIVKEKGTPVPLLAD